MSKIARLNLYIDYASGDNQRPILKTNVKNFFME
jgi:hypothetical protein